jgi:hypothetical protein
MANQTDNIQILDASTPFGTRSISSADNLQINATMEMLSDVVISGNLTLSGTAVGVELETINVEDNHIYVNAGYTTAAAQTGGIVANYLPTATTDTVAATGFTAGVPATSNPTVFTTGSGTFSATDLIQISGANLQDNNGLFEVLTHTGTTLTIKGVGLTDTAEDFTQRQFSTDTTVAGAITKVGVAVIRAGTDGAWEVANGNQTGFSFVDLGTGGSDTLQQAYVAGNTITTSAGEGNVIIAGTEEVNITTTGGLNLDTVFDFDGTTFDVNVTGSNAFSIDGTAASNLTVTGGNLTLSSVTSGDVIVSSAANVTIDGTGISIDGTSASNLTATSANLTLSTATSGTLFVTSAGLLDIDAAANIDVDVTGTFDVLATGAVSIDGSGASNLTADSGNLTLATTTSGDVIVSSIANVTVDGTGVSIDGTSASNLTTTSGGLHACIFDRR